MTTPIEYPAGPIDSNQSFMVYSEVNGSKVFLTHSYSNPNNVLLQNILSSTDNGNINAFMTDDTMVILRAVGNYNAMKFYSTTGSTRGKILVGSSNNGNMNLVFEDDNSRLSEFDHLQLQSAYQVPPESEVLLASAPYTVIANDNSITGAWNQVSIDYLENMNGTTSIVSTQLQFIPIEVYYRNDNNTCAQYSTVPIVDAGILSKVCTSPLKGFFNQCDKYPTTPLWTTLLQCDGNIPYKYCSNTEYCGQCYGACKNGLNCIYSLKNQIMTCSGSIPYTPIDPVNPVDPTNPFAPIVPATPKVKPWAPIETKPFYRQTWFIILVAAVVFLSLVIIIIYEYSSRTSTPTYTEPYILT